MIKNIDYVKLGEEWKREKEVILRYRVVEGIYRIYNFVVVGFI